MRPGCFRPPLKRGPGENKLQDGADLLDATSSRRVAPTRTLRSLGTYKGARPDSPYFRLAI